MNDEEYLRGILAAHEVTEKSDEAVAAMAVKADVEKLIRSKLKSAVPVIEVAGSFAKETMIRDHYDLDVICYFLNGETEAGDTLEDIYKNVGKILEDEYKVTPNNAALQLSTKDGDGSFLHVDVVPGRFIDDSQTDCFLYQNDGDKNRLQTNLRKHVDHVKGSGHTDVIKLIKYWRHRRGLNDVVRTFVLELAVIEALKDKRGLSLSERLNSVLTTFRDDIDSITVTDPANGNNDLSGAFDANVRGKLSAAAKSTLSTLETSGWETVFPDASKASASSRSARVASAVGAVSSPSKPYSEAI